jgi:ribose-phosphate pyrophosphokinase
MVSGSFSEINLGAINDLPLVDLVVTNTIPQTANQELCKKLRTVDISSTIAESIRRTHNGESISLLFGEWAEQSAMSILPVANGHVNEEE